MRPVCCSGCASGCGSTTKSSSAALPDCTATAGREPSFAADPRTLATQREAVSCLAQGASWGWSLRQSKENIMDETMREMIALFRYGAISELVNGPLA